MAEVLLARHPLQPEAVQFRLAHAPADNVHPGRQQRNRQGVIPVHNRRATTAENAVLGLVVARHGAVPVQVVRTHIEHCSHRQVEVARPLQLKAGQFQYVQLAPGSQQVQCRRAEVTAHPDIQPGGARHLANQLGHGGLGVGPGYPDYRGGGRPHEQVDIADDVHAGGARLLHYGGVQGEPRADHEFAGATDQFWRIVAGKHRHLGHLAAQYLQPGRIRAGIHHAEGDTLPMQIAGAGQTGGPESDHDPVHAACDHTLCHD